MARQRRLHAVQERGRFKAALKKRPELARAAAASCH